MTLPVQLLIALAATTCAVALAQRAGLSAILGYLFVGALIGPSALGLLTHEPTLALLAELGVVLLMFTVGLEFSLPRLLASKRLVLGLGTAQMLACTFVFALGLIGLSGLGFAHAATLGAALAMSSTAIVLKQLAEQLELPTEHGRVATAVLLFQDLAAVPLLVVVPLLAAGGDTTRAIAIALAKGVLVFVVLVVLGRFILPRLLEWIAAIGSLELFMLVSLLLALSAAEIAAAAGLSPTLGAFMAGMLLGETPFRHQLEADVRPFRDLMLGVFFVGIGLQLEVRVFVERPFAVLAVLGALSALKALVIWLLARVFGLSRVAAVRSALVLAQGGEFGLLVVASALSLGLIEPTLGQPLLGGLVASMALAPLIVRANERIARALGGATTENSQEATSEPPPLETEDFEHHVVIGGFGRLGQNVALLLEQQGIPTLALDLDPARVRDAHHAGAHVVFGDMTHREVLRSVGIERARAAAITFRDADAAEASIRAIKALCPDLTVLVRSVFGRDDDRLEFAGAEVFPEGPELSLAFAGQLLVLLGRAPSEVEALQSRVRANDYAPLRVFFHDTEASEQDERDYPEQMAAHVVHEGEYALGKRVDQLDLERFGVTLLALWRGALRVPPSRFDTPLRHHDVLVLQGRHDALEKARAWLRTGLENASSKSFPQR